MFNDWFEVVEYAIEQETGKEEEISDRLLEKALETEDEIPEEVNEDEDIDSALKTWDVLVNPSYKSGLDSQLLCRAMDQRQLLQ